MEQRLSLTWHCSRSELGSTFGLVAGVVAPADSRFGEGGQTGVEGDQVDHYVAQTNIQID